MKLRALKASDAKLIAALLAGDLGRFSALAALPEDDEVGRAKASAMIAGEMFVAHLDELWAWLADIAGMTTEELDDAPLEAPFEIIEQLMKSKELTGFLDSVKRLQRLYETKQAETTT